MSVAGDTRVGVPVHDLPAIAGAVIERAAGAVPGRLALTYLRVKPGRGLVAVYRVPHRPHDGPAHPPLVCLSLGEAGLERAHALARRRRPTPAELEGSWPGMLSWPDADLVLQAFPTDERLPALAAACDLAHGSPAAAALTAAASELTGDSQLRVLDASVEPLRYKPGDRCVVRYRVRLQARTSTVETTLIGKVYRDADLASRVHGLLERMHAEQLHDVGGAVRGVRIVSPLVPRPLGLVADLGLTLNEDVRRPGAEVVTGPEALGRHGTGDAIPERQLVATAVSLARLHLGTVSGGPETVRTGEGEAARARGRAQRLGEFAPAIADRAHAAAAELERRLRAPTRAPAQPAHGSFKPAQLLFRGADEVLVTDFDQLCLAEPALDVGYFLAYLRPPSLWYRRAGAREWFARSARLFAEAYRDGATELGADRRAVDATLERAGLYEAALLFKIANRRPNRLNSIRPRELEAMLAEVDLCLAQGPA
jgi:hypothetical protein